VKGSRPSTASCLAAGSATASIDRKSVHFRLKQNLHFDYGGALVFTGCIHGSFLIAIVLHV
jgi:hypothetical protein